MSPKSAPPTNCTGAHCVCGLCGLCTVTAESGSGHAEEISGNRLRHALAIEHVRASVLTMHIASGSGPRHSRRKDINLKPRSKSLDSSLLTSQPSPPALRNPRLFFHLSFRSPKSNHMLAAAPIDLTYDDDNDWLPSSKARLQRTASVGNSWGVTSIGGGYSWSTNQKDSAIEDAWADDGDRDQAPSSGSFIIPESPRGSRSFGRQITNGSPIAKPSSSSHTLSYSSIRDDDTRHSGAFTADPVTTESPLSRSPFSSAVSLTSLSTTPEILSPNHTGEAGSGPRPPMSRSPTIPRPRRRSSQQRVSLIAGRVSIVSIDPAPEPSLLAPKLMRYGSQSSFTSAASTAPPSPAAEKESFLGGRSISEFVIEGELGRGAYGLVKRAREMNVDGKMGPPVIIKQIIKSRILADCWKKHPKFGTIPIEIYVMSSISSASYVLPAKRPWDPSRLHPELEDNDPWIEGKIVKGHPNICQLLDFFEDNHYYYLVMPSTVPEKGPDGAAPPSDLFDLVESYPQGLPPNMIRSYLGQIADALTFLHSRGIVHRDVKDENVVVGRKPGSCILIDFGSSGIVKRTGWDTFSGTLDYAGPEILRGERYHGKEQDVWAFGVVAFVLLVGECPFNTAAEAQEGLESPFSNAAIALDERCGDGKESEGEEADGGGTLGDAAALVRACLRVDLADRPTFEKILESRFLSGGSGWGMES